MNKRMIHILLVILVPLSIMALPSQSFGIPELTVVEHRVIAIFVLAALCWVLEPIPIYATSLLIILLQLLFISDHGIWFSQIENTQQPLGNLLSQSSIIACFASPIIMLFLGGFFLALAASKYRLDINLARILLKPFGHNPRYVMLGLMAITALFSMFMSNTATTAMMLSILAPVLMMFEEVDSGKVAFSLAVPISANIGGIATPIGTPPNAVALKYLVGEHSIDFLQWMLIGVPFVLVLLTFAWWLLNKLFPSDLKQISMNIESKFLTTPKAIIVYITFVLTILLWLTGSWHGISAYIVALIPVTLFSMFRVINKEDLKHISWDVLWLVAGGIALGAALDKTGLAKHAIAAIPFAQFSPLLLIAGAAFLCLLMANFMSNTATANLLLPLAAALGLSVSSLGEYGGEVTLILAVTFAASLGMSLPVSTPPNALAYASGQIQSQQMLKVGSLIGIAGLLLLFLMLYLLTKVNYFM